MTDDSLIKDKMSMRHQTVLIYIADGHGARVIATKMSLSIPTIYRIMEDLKNIFLAKTLPEMVAHAFRTGWLE